MKRWFVLAVVLICAACQSNNGAPKKDMAQKISEIPMTGPMTDQVRSQQNNIEQIAQKSVTKSEEAAKRFKEEMEKAKELE